MKHLSYSERALPMLVTLACFFSGCDLSDIPSERSENPDNPEWLLKKVTNIDNNLPYEENHEFEYNSFYKPSFFRTTRYSGRYADTLIYNDQQQLIQVGMIDSTNGTISSIYLEYDSDEKLMRIWSDLLGEEYDVRYTYRDTIITSRTLAPLEGRDTPDTIRRTFVYNKTGNLLKDTIFRGEYEGYWKEYREHVEYDQYPNPYSASNLNLYIEDIFSALAIIDDHPASSSGLAGIDPILSVNNSLSDTIRIIDENGRIADEAAISLEYEYNEQGLVEREMSSSEYGSGTSVYEYVQPGDMD